MTDPISDLLTRIRNAQTARKPTVSMPASKLKVAVAHVLAAEGYVDAVSTQDEGAKRTLTVELKYYDDRAVIERIVRVSRPGLRVYKRAADIPKVQGGLGIAIVSTSAGVMTDRQARAGGHGGELLCIVS
jgi:small subunit ribosomal protein S8